MGVMTLLPKQSVAVEKLRGIKARLVGDEMGTGKTVIGIGLDFAMRKDNPELRNGPTLIVCEKIGLDVWDYHLRAMGVPSHEILIIDPTNRKQFELELKSLQQFQSGKLKTRPRLRYYVMHWDVLKSVPLINEKAPGNKPKITWAHVIADEVHLAKNRKAIRTVELKRIACEYKTGLSGTPADNQPWDIWSILHWLHPKKYRSYWRFYEEYVLYISASELGRWNKWKRNHSDSDGLNIEEVYKRYRSDYPNAGGGYRTPIGIKNVDELHRQMRPFYIRRTLLEVAPDMPEKIHVEPPVIVPMGRQQRREYDSMKEKAIALIGAAENGEGGFQLLAPAVIAVITRLQQMALATLSPEWDVKDEDYVYDEFDIEWDFPKIVLSKPSPKLDAAMNLITTHEDEPFVIFTQFKGMADLVEEECERLKIPVVKITGDIHSKNERTHRIEQFQEGKARVFVGTIAAAGKTITLTRACHCIFVDLSWNHNKNEQAAARLWRMGQRNAVRIYRIESADSIDQVRFDKIKTKGELTSAIMNPRSTPVMSETNR